MEQLSFADIPTKRCPNCSAWKPLEAFARKKKSRDGRQPWCRACNAERSKRYYAEHRADHVAVVAQRTRGQRRERHAVLAAYFAAHPCVDCGETDLLVLEFDHLRDKRMNIGTMISSGCQLDQIFAEIEKCEVVCANCHRRRTAMRARSWRWRWLENEVLHSVPGA